MPQFFHHLLESVVLLRADQCVALVEDECRRSGDTAVAGPSNLLVNDAGKSTLRERCPRQLAVQASFDHGVHKDIEIADISRLRAVRVERARWIASAVSCSRASADGLTGGPRPSGERPEGMQYTKHVPGCPLGFAIFVHVVHLGFLGVSNLWIRVTYGVLLAIVVTLTVAFGVTMALAGPRPPDTPSLTFRQLQSVGDNQQDTDRIIGVVDRFYQDAYDYRRAYPSFQRNVLVVTVLLAIIIGGAGIALGPSFNYLRFGLTLSAALLLVYAAAITLSPAPNPAPSSGSVTGLLAAGSPPGLDFASRFLRFAASFIALLVFLFLGLWRLTDWTALGVVGSAKPSAPGTSNGAPTSDAGAPAGSGSVGSPPERIVWGRPESE
ncbi:MAG TPA: hypothetical protein VK821_13375 [Dehalococcoidia bacterium]|nr:hypothetical protein [Dehalococcoidia bacterium]